MSSHPVEPTPPDVFRSRLHSTRNASLLGIALGITFSICFITGVLSHLIQHPPSWFEWPSRPAGLYRVTQGLHVISGLASLPLLFGKLWTVYPRLWIRPAVTSVLHAVERLALVPLVAGSLFLLFSGVANVSLWYPYDFFFPAAHYWAAWITVGALIVHVGAKWHLVRHPPQEAISPSKPAQGGSLTRRSFLGVITGVTGLLTIVTAGQTVPLLKRLAILAPRKPDVGPQGFPVNKTAAGAGVDPNALNGYRLRVEGRVSRPLSLSLDDLRSFPQHTAELPIACVEGWSTSQSWTGIRVTDLLAAAIAESGREVLIESIQSDGRYRSSILTADQAHDPDALLALEVNGEPLHLDHGSPLRLIAPNRPGVMQTKWVERVTVT
jgi:hypothetical protein